VGGRRRERRCRDRGVEEEGERGVIEIGRWGGGKEREKRDKRRSFLSLFFFP
jgi:hypothetical protein